MRLMALSRVDFPDPEGPIKAVISLGWKKGNTIQSLLFIVINGQVFNLQNRFCHTASFLTKVSRYIVIGRL